MTVRQHSPRLTHGTRRLFAAWNPEPGSPPSVRRDKHGFVESSSSTFRFEQLLELPAALIVAPPFMGKTTVAKGIYAYLEGLAGGDSPRDRRTTVLPPVWFEKPLPRDWLPAQAWDAWRRSRKHAVWIIDAVDEGEHQESGVAAELLQLLERLTPQERARLVLLIFSRASEIPSGLLKGLSDIYEDELSHLELLPVDKQTARKIVGDEEFSRILELIEDADLASIAGYPCVLESLKRRAGRQPESRIDVWHALLMDLLKTPYLQRERHPETELIQQFSVASRLAVALTFGPDEEMVTEASIAEGLPITEVLPTDESSAGSAPLQRQLLRRSGYEALKSAMFQRTATGHRFAQRNIQDWMCAWGLRNWPPEKVKPLLSEASEGKIQINPAYREIAKLLEDVARESREPNPRLADWVAGALGDIPEPAEASPWGIDRVREVLDRLEERAAEGGWLRLDEEKLAKLDAPGLDSELAERLRDTAKPPPARAVSVSVAAAIKARAVVSAAAEVACHEDDDIQIRIDCAYLLRRLGDDLTLRSLIPFLEAEQPGTRVEMRLTAALILALVEREIWTSADAYPHLPAGTDDQVIDAVQTLPSVVSDRMSLQDAQSIIETTQRTGFSEIIDFLEDAQHRSPFPFYYSPKVRVFLEAVRKVADRPKPLARDLESLIPFCLRVDRGFSGLYHSLVTILQRAFQARQRARRKLFSEYARKLAVEPGQVSPIWGFVLEQADLEWLIRKMTHPSNKPRQLWMVLLSLASGEGVSGGTASRARSLAEERAPEILADFDDQQGVLKEWEEKHLQEQEEARQKEVRRLEEVDREILATIEPGTADLLWSLSWANFSEPGFRPANIEGEWPDLSDELKDEILEQCAAALEKATPTPIPDGRTFPGRVVYEGQAFVRVAAEGSDCLPLTPDLIRKWLGSALCFRIPGWIETLETCFAVDKEATEEVVLAEIGREIRSSGDSHSVLLQDLPEELWTETITTWVESSVLSQELPVAARIPLLRLLGGRRPARGEIVAKRLLEAGRLESLRGQYWLSEPADDLDLAVANVLLALDPGTVWPELEERIRDRGKSLLTELRVLVDPIQGGLQARLEKWPVSMLGELAEVLFEHFPPATDPSLEDIHLVTSEIELRNLRWRLAGLLLESQDSASSETLQRLSERYLEVKSWLARRGAEEDLVSSTKSVRETLYVVKLSREQVCRMIQDGDYRLVRNESDLLDVVMEELEAIGETVPDHLDMLYHTGGSATGGGPKHQYETALQAYILCRLFDRLPGRVLDREAQIKWRRRTDIRVLAPTTSGGTAKVVIEVKWSDHREISTALKEQLGRQYLYQQDLTHGIYLVGWCGKVGTWRQTENPRSKPRDMDAFSEALRRQAGELAETYPGVEVRSCVLNCLWRDDG